MERSLYLFMPNLVVLLYEIISLFHPQDIEWKTVRISGFAQGTTYSITYYASDSSVRKKQVDSILSVIDESLSLYKKSSLINRFNSSEKGITVDDHFVKVVDAAIATQKETGGIFDITIQPLTEAWGFGPKKMKMLPDEAQIKILMRCVGSEKIQLKKNVLTKSAPCVRLDANGIAQGYTVDVLAQFLEQHNIKNYLVEVGGELRIGGYKQPSGDLMKVAIESPGENEFELESIQKIIQLTNGAITTSGNYRKFYESKGQKISHIIDGRTGFPANNDLISVTVVAKDALTADAYDNAIMVMGMKKGLQFVEQREWLAAYFIYKTKDGAIKDTASSKFLPLMKNSFQ